MKRQLNLTFVILLLLSSCSEDSIAPQRTTKENPNKGPKNTNPTTPLNVSGLTKFKASELFIPSGGLPDAQRFYSEGKLRASTAYNPYGITSVNKNGVQRVRYFVNPTTAPEYLIGMEYPYHHRAEFTRYPWNIDHELGTEEWLGFSYIFPTTAEGYVQNQTPVSIYQNHAGSVAGKTSNPPALQLEIAHPGQLKSSDPSRSTPLGGEIMIINNVRGIRYVVPGIRVQSGARINIVIQIVYGTETTGLFNVWINGKLFAFPGDGVAPAGNSGSTVWADNPVGGNSKLGLYHHQMRFDNYVKSNSISGHYKMEMFMTDWNEIIRKPSDWDYKNTNAYNEVETSGYQ